MQKAIHSRLRPLEIHQSTAWRWDERRRTTGRPILLREGRRRLRLGTPGRRGRRPSVLGARTVLCTRNICMAPVASPHLSTTVEQCPYRCLNWLSCCLPMTIAYTDRYRPAKRDTMAGGALFSVVCTAMLVFRKTYFSKRRKARHVTIKPTSCH